MSKLLNQIPVLDKGFVALFSSSMSREELSHLRVEFFKNKPLTHLFHIPHLHLMIKCPLFVQLSFTETKLTAVTKPQTTVEAYVPSVNEVGAKDLESSRLIQESIEQTTDALLLNPRAYQMDGCDIFVSQVMSPINIYNVLMVSGSLNDWVDYICRSDLPAPIEQYRKAIEDVLLAEWSDIRGLLDEKKQKKRRR